MHRAQHRRPRRSAPTTPSLVARIALRSVSPAVWACLVVLGAYGLTSPEGERGIHYRALQRAVRGAASAGELEAYRSALTHTGDPPCLSVPDAAAHEGRVRCGCCPEGIRLCAHSRPLGLP